jgi:hypothetical protein
LTISDRWNNLCRLLQRPGPTPIAPFPQWNAAAAKDIRRMVWLVLLVSLCANGIMLLIDHEPLFIIGDSMVYVNSAFGTGGPGDRSFAYGRYLIRPLLWVFGSLNSVVVAQAIMSACCAAMLAAILCLGFGVHRWIAFVIGVSYTAEPLALLYQRMMMTEGPALFCLAGFFLLSILYLRSPRVRLLGALAAANVACVAFRVGLLPIVVICMLLLPPLALLRQWPLRRDTLTQCATHLIVSLVLMYGTHALYQHLYHKVTGLPPAYNSADGYFLLASWAPLITRADFPDPALFDQIRPTLGSDLANRFTRPGQRFSPDGLIGRLIESQHNNERMANALAKQIAINAGRRDPLGVLALGWRTYLDFWNPTVMANVLQVDEGQLEADRPLIDIFRARYNEDISGHQLIQSFVKSWHGRAALWYRFVLLVPLVWLAALVFRLRYWRALLLLGVSAIGLLLVDTMLVVEPVVRYLHSIAWLTILFCGVIVQGLYDLLGGAALMLRRSSSKVSMVPEDVYR